MEDTKLKNRAYYCLYGEKREGMGLVSVLVITVLSAAIIGVMFMMTSTFTASTITFRTVYSDQVLASSFTEQAKGIIVNEIRSTGITLHPTVSGDAWINRPQLSSVADLQIDGPGNVLAVNEVVSGVSGSRRRVVSTVFDLTYTANTSDHSSMVEDLDDAERALLPPSSFVLDLMGSGPVFENVAETNDPTITYSDNPNLGGGLTLDEIGAYLIRVQIFGDTPRVPNEERLLRTTEESFFILTRNS